MQNGRISATSPDTRNSTLRTVIVGLLLCALVAVEHVPTFVILVTAVALVVREARRGGVEHGLRTASFAFIPVLVAMERSNVAPTHGGHLAHPASAELAVWAVLLCIGAFVPRRGAPTPKSGRARFMDDAPVASPVVESAQVVQLEAPGAVSEAA